MSDAPDLRPTLILPDWPAPTSVGAFVTTRETGPSQGDFACFNPAEHVGDNADHVALCRRLLEKQVDGERPLLWLDQVHGARVQQHYEATPPEADAAVALSRDYACVVMTADCLPVFFSDIAAPGWRWPMPAGEAWPAACWRLRWRRWACRRRSSSPGWARRSPTPSSRSGPRSTMPSSACIRTPVTPSTRALIAWATTWPTSTAWPACAWSAWVSRTSAEGTSAPPASRASTPIAATTAKPAAWPA